jgi:hypothetical protein
MAGILTGNNSAKPPNQFPQKSVQERPQKRQSDPQRNRAASRASGWYFRRAARLVLEAETAFDGAAAAALPSGA